MNNWSIEQSQALYNVAEWGEGFFTINSDGKLCVRGPQNVPLEKITAAIEKAGLSLPVLVRFTDILQQRIQDLAQAFVNAMQQYSYQSKFTPAYPIKVNQQRHVVEEILQHPDVGLEAGSKPELMAVLGLAHKPNSLIICNGYKDQEYIRLALIGQQLGHRVYLIVEKFSELELILAEAARMQVSPLLGVRVRLASLGSSKWQNTGGEKSKFGLSAMQVLQLIERLKQTEQLSFLQLLHFHMGSQIANIRDIQRGMQEGARYYAELCRLGANIQCVDVGGGLSVDYEGTRSRSFCSANYSLQEYANNIIGILHDTCREQQLPHPQVFTEAGRAMTAHHAILITDVIGKECVSDQPTITVSEQAPQLLQELQQSLQKKPSLETYHDACYLYSEAQSLYIHGMLNLAQRATAEQLYIAIALRVKKTLQADNKIHREALDEINEKFAEKLFVNFSLFQSIPDVWAIDQIFPIMPLTNLDKKPTRRVVLEDLTCDSDGRIDRYIDGQGVEATLPLPAAEKDKPFLLGIFLVGAYQEILGDIHNLFGDTNSVHVALKADGDFTLLQSLAGDTAADVLTCVNFDIEKLLQTYREQLAKSDLPMTQQATYFEELQQGLSGYTYFENTCVIPAFAGMTQEY